MYYRYVHTWASYYVHYYKHYVNCTRYIRACIDTTAAVADDYLRVREMNKKARNLSLAVSCIEPRIQMVSRYVY